MDEQNSQVFQNSKGDLAVWDGKSLTPLPGEHVVNSQGQHGLRDRKTGQVTPFNMDFKGPNAAQDQATFTRSVGQPQANPDKGGEGQGLFGNLLGEVTNPYKEAYQAWQDPNAGWGRRALATGGALGETAGLVFAPEATIVGHLVGGAGKTLADKYLGEDSTVGKIADFAGNIAGGHVAGASSLSRGALAPNAARPFKVAQAGREIEDITRGGQPWAKDLYEVADTAAKGSNPTRVYDAAQRLTGDAQEFIQTGKTAQKAGKIGSPALESVINRADPSLPSHTPSSWADMTAARKYLDAKIKQAYNGNRGDIATQLESVRDELKSHMEGISPAYKQGNIQYEKEAVLPYSESSSGARTARENTFQPYTKSNKPQQDFQRNVLAGNDETHARYLGPDKTLTPEGNQVGQVLNKMGPEPYAKGQGYSTGGMVAAAATGQRPFVGARVAGSIVQKAKAAQEMLGRTPQGQRILEAAIRNGSINNPDWLNLVLGKNAATFGGMEGSKALGNNQVQSNR